MKKLLTIITFLTILIIIFWGTKLIQAQSTTPTICYDGNYKEISFINDNGTDLFKNLKEIMPGDVKEQTILFKAKNIKKETKVFLVINGDVNKEFKKYISIKVFKDNKELKNNGEYIELGTFSKDEEFNLSVIVEVSNETGNEINDIELNIDWKIFIQETDRNINTNNGNNDGIQDIIEVPVTKDNSNINVYIIVFILSGITTVILIVLLSKKG